MARLRVQEVAVKQGLNMSQLSRRTGLTPGMVRRYWYNEVGEVSLPALDKLAGVLSVEPGDLIEREDEQDTKRAA
jgi:DNA-binding Xre family transcriptional regulator